MIKDHSENKIATPSVYLTISLFLKWFLNHETLVRQKGIKNLLRLMDEGKVVDEKAWIELMRLRLLRVGIYTLSGILERPLEQDEVVHLFERIEKFVQLYGLRISA